MDDPPNRKRPVSPKGFWVLIGLSLFFTAKAELYCTFEILPIENKIYVRDDSRVHFWEKFHFQKYVRIEHTESIPTTNGDYMDPNHGKRQYNEVVFYVNAEKGVGVNRTVDQEDWRVFKEVYNDF